MSVCIYIDTHIHCTLIFKVIHFYFLNNIYAYLCLGIHSTAKDVAAYTPNVNICSGVGFLVAFTFLLVFLYFDLGGGHKKILLLGIPQQSSG